MPSYLKFAGASRREVCGRYWQKHWHKWCHSKLQSSSAKRQLYAAQNSPQQGKLPTEGAAVSYQQRELHPLLQTHDDEARYQFNKLMQMSIFRKFAMIKWY